MQLYLWRESYSALLPPYFPTISHFSPFVPAHGRSLDPTSANIDITIMTGCSCNDIYWERATPDCNHFIPPSKAWKFSFWLFLAIFHHLCQRMRDPLIPSPLLLTNMLSAGADEMISTERELLQSFTTPFSRNLPIAKKLIFLSFLAIFHHFYLLMGQSMTPSLL